MPPGPAALLNENCLSGGIKGLGSAGWWAPVNSGVQGSCPARRLPVNHWKVSNMPPQQQPSPFQDVLRARPGMRGGSQRQPITDAAAWTPPPLSVRTGSLGAGGRRLWWGSLFRASGWTFILVWVSGCF